VNSAWILETSPPLLPGLFLPIENEILLSWFPVPTNSKLELCIATQNNLLIHEMDDAMNKQHPCCFHVRLRAMYSIRSERYQDKIANEIEKTTRAVLGCTLSCVAVVTCDGSLYSSFW
jgi:hypothetical protein